MWAVNGRNLANWIIARLRGWYWHPSITFYWLERMASEAKDKDELMKWVRGAVAYRYGEK